MKLCFLPIDSFLGTLAIPPRRRRQRKNSPASGPVSRPSPLPTDPALLPHAAAISGKDRHSLLRTQVGMHWLSTTLRATGALSSSPPPMRFLPYLSSSAVCRNNFFTRAADHHDCAETIGEGLQEAKHILGGIRAAHGQVRHYQLRIRAELLHLDVHEGRHVCSLGIHLPLLHSALLQALKAIVLGIQLRTLNDGRVPDGLRHLDLLLLFDSVSFLVGILEEIRQLRRGLRALRTADSDGHRVWQPQVIQQPRLCRHARVGIGHKGLAVDVPRVHVSDGDRDDLGVDANLVEEGLGAPEDFVRRHVLLRHHGEETKPALLPHRVQAQQVWQQHEDPAIVHNPPDVDGAVLKRLVIVRELLGALHHDGRLLAGNGAAKHADEGLPLRRELHLAPGRVGEHQAVRLQNADTRSLDRREDAFRWVLGHDHTGETFHGGFAEIGAKDLRGSPRLVDSRPHVSGQERVHQDQATPFLQLAGKPDDLGPARVPVLVDVRHEHDLRPPVLRVHLRSAVQGEHLVPHDAEAEAARGVSPVPLGVLGADVQ
mmetsp:Transcript_5983/g.23240  ORF Transcript_5983/g.23240 Transcript_5983/m.23240 type:complete len:542 (-) Transcript_5983:1543-3168(-)